MARFPFQQSYYNSYNKFNNDYYKNSTNHYNNYYDSHYSDSVHNQSDLKSNNFKDYKDDKRNNVQAEPQKKSSKSNSFLPFSLNLEGFSNSDNPIIEIMGIKLFLDDIIILCLLFILYKEEITDEILFISLLLLLIS